MDRSYDEIVATLSPEGQALFPKKAEIIDRPLLDNKDSNNTYLSSPRQLQNVRKSLDKTLETDLYGTSLSQTIREWVNQTSGWFSTDELDRDLCITSSADKNNRRFVMFTLVKEEIVERNQKQNKLFRRIDKGIRLIDFKRAGNKRPLEVKMPFGIEKYVNIYPRNIIIVAGTADAGKTALLLNFIRLNQDKFSIYYYSSEMGEDELANRLSKFDGIALEDWKFAAEERSTNFADVIRPDDINLIDFLEISRDFSEVADHIRAIHDKLNSGICIIAIQKNPGADLGRGGSFSLEKARLYLSMDAGVATIIKAKNWVDPEFNPNRLKIKYKIVGGCKFIINEDWHKNP